jgi:hypothetical protein
MTAHTWERLGDTAMFDDEKPIRYHLTEDYELDPGDHVFADRLITGTADWERRFEITDHAKENVTNHPARYRLERRRRSMACDD